MKTKIRSFLAIAIAIVLAVTSIPANVTAFDWTFYDDYYEREYSNSVSSGTYEYLRIKDNFKITYSSGKVAEFLDTGMEYQNLVITDGFGTVYFYKRISVTEDRSLQVYYYNKDINKNSQLEPLYNENSNYVYTRMVYNWDVNSDGTVTIQKVVTDDGDQNGIFTPNFELMKQQYDQMNPNVTPEPETPNQGGNTAAPVPENPSQGGDTVTQKPDNPSQGGDDVTPKPEIPTQQPTATTKPTATQKPTGSIGTSGSKEIIIKKSGNSVAVTENGEVISKVTFNKKKGIATFQVKNKNKKVKKVKQAFIIRDSYNYGYITKANKFKTINRKTGKTKTYSGKWKKATIKKNVAVNIVKLKGSKKKKITGF